MNKLYKTVRFLFLLIPGLGFAQGPGNIWYFGQNAGLTFASGSPVALTNGKINTNEGCSVVSDCSGNLLFYTDGVTVWTKNNTAMPNGTGLLGNWTTTESSICVPLPGSTTKYLIFNPSDMSMNTGFNYSTVDMTLNGGLGDVVAATKNTFLLDSVSEKATSVINSDGVNYWVITTCYKKQSGGFYAYLITSAGVSATPVVTKGVGIGVGTDDLDGYLRFSADGKKLAQAFESNAGIVETYDFDATTGIISNAMTFPGQTWYTPGSGPNEYYGAYGLEFSPNGNLLYVGYETADSIFQFNLAAGSYTAILASATCVGVTKLGAQQVGALQLGPNGKIYVATYDSPDLGVINSPNTVGTACNYVDAGVSLGGKLSLIGLPNFVTSIFNPFPAITASIASSSSPSCAGRSDGSAVASATGGNGTFTYSWSNGLSGATVSSLAAGTYTVTVSGVAGSGCSSGPSTNISTVTITDPTAIAITTSSSPESCSQSNGAVWITAVSNGNPSYTYSWSSGISAVTSSNLVHGTYTVTVTDATGCSATQSASVFEPVPLTASVSVSQTSCGNSNGSVVVTATNGSPGYSYKWSNGSNAATISSLPASGFTVTVTDSWGCSVTTEAILNASSSPTALIQAASNPTCFGLNNGSAAVTVFGGTANYTYTWSPSGGAGATASGIGANTYTVTVTDADGCTGTSTVLVTAPSVIDPVSGSLSASCGSPNGTAFASSTGGTPAYSYSWNTGSTDSVVSGLISGSYSLTVTDAKGCTQSLVQVVNNTGGPALSSGILSEPSCNGSSNGSAQVGISGGTPGYSYSWSNGSTSFNGAISGSGLTLSDLSAGTYSVTITDAIGCQAQSTVSITAPSALISSLPVSANVSCFGGSNGMIVCNVTGGTPGYTYSWSNGLTGTCSIGLVIPVSGLGTGDYSITITDANSCTSSSAITLTQPSAIVPDMNATDASCGASNGSAEASATGGTGSYLFVWSNGFSGATGSGSLVSVSGLLAGNYTVTVTDGNSCTVTAVTTVSNLGAASLSVSSTQTVCTGGSAVLSAGASGGSAPYTYSWSAGLPGGTSQTVSPDSTTTYLVSVKDSAGCASVAQAIVVKVNPLPKLSVSSDIAAGCGAPLCVQFTGISSSGCSGAKWNFGDSDTSAINNPLHCYSSTGVFSVSFSCTDANGCSSTSVSTGMISVFAKPKAAFDYTPTVVVQGNPVNFSNQSTGSTSYLWKFNDPHSETDSSSIAADPSHTFQDTGKYCIMLVAGSASCADTTQHCMEVGQKCNFPDSIPNVFTPNGDGINDQFKVKVLGLSELNCTLYNRWGMLIYEYNAMDTGWDGRTYAESNAPVGTYYYIFNATCMDGTKKEANGFVELLR